MKFKEQMYRYLFWGLVTLVLIPIFLGTFQNYVFGFTKGEILTYYGGILSNLITFVALIITINHSNRDRKQDFNFQIAQKNISKFEEFIRKVCLNLMMEYELFNKLTIIPFELILIDKNNNIQQLNIDKIYDNILKAFNHLDKTIFTINSYKNEIKLYIYDYFCNKKIIEDNISLLNKELEKYLSTLNDIRRIFFEFQKIIHDIKIVDGYVSIEQNNKFAAFKHNLTNILMERSKYEENEYKDFLNKIKEFLQLINEESIKLKNNLDN